jgi:hypothetical protein
MSTLNVIPREQIQLKNIHITPSNYHIIVNVSTPKYQLCQYISLPKLRTKTSQYPPNDKNIIHKIIKILIKVYNNLLKLPLHYQFSPPLNYLLCQSPPAP